MKTGSRPPCTPSPTTTPRSGRRASWSRAGALVCQGSPTRWTRLFWHHSGARSAPTSPRTRQRDFIRSTFGRYVSPEVAQELLTSPAAQRLGGEKRELTVLMSDLRGYTRFAELGEAEHVMAVLNDVLARMTDVIIAHGGTINEFIGDAIFAIFGAPIAHFDHAERAAAAAIAMQRSMASVNEAHAKRGLPRFEMGIGINTGEAVVGRIGSEQRAKYAVVGAAVNLAARVEGCTVGGQILLSPHT